MEILAAKIFIEAAILCGLLRLIAKHEADCSYTKVVIVSAVMTTVNFFLLAILLPKIGFFVIIPIALFVSFMISTFCWVSKGKSIIIVTIYLAFHLGLTALVAFLDKKANEDMQNVMDQPAQRSMNETINVLEGFYGEGAGDALMPDNTPMLDPAKPETEAPKPEQPPAKKAEPTPKVIEKGGDEWAEAKYMLSIGSTMRAGNKSLVSINGKFIETGEEVRVEYNEKIFVWRLKGIKGREVDLTPVRTE